MPIPATSWSPTWRATTPPRGSPPFSTNARRTGPGEPDAFLAAAPESRRDDGRRLDTIFRETTGWAPRVWGKTLGYGRYAYRYDSGHCGEWFATGFGLQARQIALYILPGYTDFPDIAARLGAHRRGRSCWYLSRFDRVDESVLRELIRAGLDDLERGHEIRPS